MGLRGMNQIEGRQSLTSTIAVEAAAKGAAILFLFLGGGREAGKRNPTKEQYSTEDKGHIAPSTSDNEKLNERGKSRASFQPDL